MNGVLLFLLWSIFLAKSDREKLSKSFRAARSGVHIYCEPPEHIFFCCRTVRERDASR